MIDVKESLEKNVKLKKAPRIVLSSIVKASKKILHEDDINKFLLENIDSIGIDFIDAVLEYFNIDFTRKQSEIENIPHTGRVVIIANHPLGALDALSLIKLVYSVRQDVKILANDLLNSFDPIKEFLLPVNILKQKFSKSTAQMMTKHLEDEGALIIFPSGEVSRSSLTGIKDKKWKKGFLNTALKTQSPILPVHIKSKNSMLFYSASIVNNTLGTLLLPHELFKSKKKRITISVGNLIPYDSFRSLPIKKEELVNIFRKHIYLIGRGKSGVFETETAIAHPERAKEIRNELKNCKLLGETSDNKKIYLYDYKQGSIMLKELGRLRELSFRKVGEGSGLRRDVDEYDKNYEHIILWSDEDLEIVGAYRVANTKKVVVDAKNALYTSTLFTYSKEFEKYFDSSLELGRSFVQPKYWGSRALDYLWQGIGAYLKHHPEVTHMFGPVSLSGKNPKIANDLIVHFYNTYFEEKDLVTAKSRYELGNYYKLNYKNLFSGKEFVNDFRELKSILSEYNTNIPTLYKQYVDLFEDGGIKFLDFCVDEDFNSVDGFILCDISKIKEKKRKRYIDKI